MEKGILKWLRTVYKQTIASIAFIPALIAIFFLLLSFFMVQFDTSESGKAIKTNAHWLTLKDASTARSIISAIVSGIISLTVFSFSMVMILLNQAASHMSNRVIDKLIGNRFQQIVLGFYIGTIVYALFLLSTIREVNSGINVPAISTYFLIGLTVIDIFFFIYFLHYVTQSGKYETIIHRIHDTTKKSMEKSCVAKSDTEGHANLNDSTIINAYKSGIYQGFVREGLLSFCQKEDIVISFLYPTGTSILQGNPLMEIRGHQSFPETFEDDLSKLVNIYRGQEIKSNYYYGLKQLMEVAVKALSPGINDPGTAILSLQALGNLLSFRLQNHPSTHIKDKTGVVRIISYERSFSELFKDCIFPIWDYGKADRLVLKELQHVLLQLKSQHDHPLVNELSGLVQRAIAKQEQEQG